MISIIVPVYNSEKYLEECIASVFNQSYTDWELILVDDGSTDNSPSILDRLSRDKRNITVIHNTNGGVTSARREGVKVATGKWITFLDSDDTLPIYALQKLVDASSESTDIVIGALSNHQTPDFRIRTYDEYRNDTIKGWHFHTGPVAKLFRRTLFDNFTFDIPREIVFGEDMIMNIRLAFNNRKDVKVIPDTVYQYNLCDSSTTNHFETSEEYEALFRAHWERSIPSEQKHKYAKAIFRKVFDGFMKRLLSKDDFTRLNWRKDNEYLYIKKLCSDYNLSLSKLEWVVLNLKPIWMVNYLLLYRHNKC